MDRMATLLTTSHGRPVFSQDFVGTNPATGVYAATMDYESDGQRGGVFETRYNPDGSVLTRTAIDYTYDALRRLTSTVTDSTVDTQDASESFTFDLASNRISSTRTGTNPGITTYRYDARNRMVDQTNTPTGGTATVTANTFDAQGNQLTSGTDRYLYDSRGRLARAIIDGVTTRYDYDIAGERISQSRSATTTSTTTTFLSDKHNATGYPQVIEETTRTSAAGAFTTTLRSNTVGVRIEAQSDRTITLTNGTTTITTTGPLNLVRDAKGSVRTLLRPDGQQLERYDFTSFGEAALFQRIDPATSVVTTITVSQASTAQLFGGDAESDNATGLYFAGVRVRRAADGNWLSQDPSFFGPGALGDANLYSFVGGNPVSRWDPSGLWSFTEILTVGGGLLLGGLFFGSFAKSFYHGVVARAPVINPAAVPARHKQFALLANDVYKAQASALGGWQPVSPTVLKAIGLSPSDFKSGGFHAQLYVSGSSLALVFEGTSNGGADAPDMYTNLGQGLAGTLLPTQYGRAVSLAQSIKSSIGGADLTLVGHSLGGGLAAAAALATNRPAVTFNAAGLNPLSELFNGSPSYTGGMTRYSVDGEILTLLQQSFLVMPYATIGKEYKLEPVSADRSLSRVGLHGMDVMMRALGL